MRSILFLAVAAVLLGGYAARYADRAVASRPQTMAATVQLPAEPRQPTSSRSLMVDSDRLGHFRVDARIDGQSIDFLVDTGASVIALRETDAARARIFPNASDYNVAISTANGKIKAARAMLNRVELGGITVYDVPAIVLPDEALAQSLLGMSFLSKLRRYEVANGRLVLER
jgi:aspartyl protease family protein